MQELQGNLGPYSLIRELGAGGNGTVWLAKGPTGEVAIKILHRREKDDSRPRFHREISVLRQLADVDGVLPLLDIATEPEMALRPWFSMPVAKTLPEQLGAEAPLTSIFAAMAAIAIALARVHTRGFAHRDIKPDNLYWHNGEWCIGDFGLAEVEDALPLTRSDRKLGPLHYLAPEMLNSPVTADGKRADVYSLAKTIWVLASGQRYPLPGVHDPAFAGTAIGSFRQDDRTRLLDELLRRMTSLDPAKRPCAETVAKEMAILERGLVADPAPDSSSAIERLKAALAPHFEQARTVQDECAVARSSLALLRKAVERLAREIHAKTNLERLPSIRKPATWTHLGRFGSVRELWKEDGGCTFEAGSAVHRWRLSIMYAAYLMSDGKVTAHAGYDLLQMVNGNPVRTSSSPRTWMDGGAADNGTPSAAELILQLSGGLERNLSPTLDQFALLVSQLPLG